MEWRRYKEALQEAEQLLRLDPEDADAYALIARIHLILDEYEKALFFAGESLKREPENELAWYVRVGVYYETKNEQAFREAVEEAQRIDPYEAQYFFLKANLLTRKGKYQASKEELLQALELSPENPLFLASLSYVEALLRDVEESRRLDRQAIRYDAEEPHVLLYLAWAASHRGDYDLQETYMKTAVRLNPEDKQFQDEYLEALQNSQKLFRAFLWPTKFLRRLKSWQVLVAWIAAWMLFKPLVIVFIVLYVIAHWVTKGIVHVRVFGWRRRGS
jgi:tetratricopeptide (TPR) repeat protein